MQERGWFALQARFLVQRPRFVLAVWATVLALAIPGASWVPQVLTAQAELGSDSEAVQVSRAISERFPADGADATLLLVRPRDASLPADAFDAALQSYRDVLTADPAIAAVRSVPQRLGAQPLTDAFLGQVLFDDATLAEVQRAVRDARSAARELPELQVALAGAAATTLELQQVSARDARRGELIGLPLSLVVLTIAFGALVAAGLPLLSAGTTVVVTLGLIWATGQVLPFAGFTQSIVSMLGLATGIDYALLMTNRFREELRAGRAPREAAYVTATRAGRAVTFSGATVLVALAALLVPPLPYVRSVGLGTMLVILVSVAVSTTAMPALLSLLGHRVNALPVTRRTPGLRTSGFWRGRAEAILRRPLAYVVVGLAGLALLTSPAATMHLADPGAAGLPPASEARQVLAALDEVGLGGMLGSLVALVDVGEQGFFGPVTPRNVSRLVRALEDLPDVGGVFSPFAAAGVPRLLLLQYYVDEDLARGSDVAPLLAATVGSDARTLQLQVVPASDLPPDRVAALTLAVRDAVSDAGFEALVGGNASFEAEWTRTLYGAFPVALLIVVVATLVLLGIAFRSVLIPVKSILLNALTVSAAYGVVVLVFQHGWGASLLGLDGGFGYIDSNVPLFLFAIVFGLSMDYEVFLVSRIYENHRAGMSDREAVTAAMASTGSVITSAAAVMLAVFSAFFFSEVVLIQMLGVGLAVAVVLDATLVRLTLVPAVMTLAGRFNWWAPAPLLRLLDRFTAKP